MKIDVVELYKKALDKKIHIRVGNDDPSLTYQEYFLYYVLYFIFGKISFIENIDKEIEFYKGSWIDESWEEMAASKISKKEITIPWEKVFD